MKFQRIQDLRTDADLSQRELSEILHISVDYLVGRTDKKEMNK